MELTSSVDEVKKIRSSQYTTPFFSTTKNLMTVKPGVLCFAAVLNNLKTNIFVKLKPVPNTAEFTFFIKNIWRKKINLLLEKSS